MRQYTKEDLPRLLEENPSLHDTVGDMIDLAIKSGAYTEEEITAEFIEEYLLEEINTGFIKIKKEF